MRRKVVLTPDLIVAALFDANCRAVLEAWRDGHLLPVCNRELLLSYVKLFRAIGQSAEIIKWWTLWLTTPGKALYLESFETNKKDPIEICTGLAIQSEAREVISWRDGAQHQAGESIQFITAANFLEQSNKQNFIQRL